MFGIAVDCVEATGFDRKHCRLVIIIHKTEYECVWIGLRGVRGIPSGCSVTAENELACSDDCQRSRLVVALGMKSFRLKSIATRSIEQLELLPSKIAQLDEVALHLVAANYL